MTPRHTAPALAIGAAALLFACGSSAGEIVFEAEHCLALRPNLEIHREKGASGGLAVGTFEGGGGNHTWLGGMNSSIDIGTCEYPFRLERAGSYVVWARAWWSDGCGNSILVSVDGRGRHAAGDEHGEDPVIHRWHWVPSDPFTLAGGEHVLNVMAKEDDVRIDQWCIAPAGWKPKGAGRPGEAPEPAMEPNYVPRRAKPVSGDLDMGLWRRSEVVDSRGRIELVAYVRRSATDAAKVGLRVDSGEKRPEGVGPTELEVALPEGRVLVPVPVTVTYPADSPRSEKVIRVTLLSGKVEVAQREVVVTRPWRWHILGRLKPGVELDERLGRGTGVDLGAAVPRELLRDGEKPGAARWEEAKSETLFDRYGRIDFERYYGLTVGATAYLYAEVHSPREQTVKSFMNNDDDVRVYLNGDRVFTKAGGHPAEGFLWRTEFRMRKGTNRFLVRVGQSSKPKPPPGGHPPNYWLFRMRLRRSAHRPAELWGR